MWLELIMSAGLFQFCLYSENLVICGICSSIFLFCLLSWMACSTDTMYRTSAHINLFFTSFLRVLFSIFLLQNYYYIWVFSEPHHDICFCLPTVPLNFLALFFLCFIWHFTKIAVLSGCLLFEISSFLTKNLILRKYTVWINVHNIKLLFNLYHPIRHSCLLSVVVNGLAYCLLVSGCLLGSKLNALPKTEKLKSIKRYSWNLHPSPKG